MATTKHDVIDVDSHFIVDPYSREVKRKSADKLFLMQHDKNSERFTFEVPLKIEEHDMSKCDVIQVHYENVSSGTSVSTRKYYRGVYVVRGEGEEVHDDVKMDTAKDIMTFSWLIPEEATQFAGKLNFQLKFVCHDEEFADVELFKWHSEVNSEIGINAGLPYSANDMPASATATLQSIEVLELDTGVEIILDGVAYSVNHGQSGVYIGSGEMPEHCNVQIDPNGVSMDPATVTQTIDENSTKTEFPSAKAVYEYVDSVFAEVNALLEQVVNGEEA